MGIREVKPGYRGLKANWWSGQVEKTWFKRTKVLKPGYYTYSGLNDIYPIKLTNRTITYAPSVFPNDGYIVHANVSMNVSVNVHKINNIYDLKDERVKYQFLSIMISLLRQICGDYSHYGLEYNRLLIIKRLNKGLKKNRHKNKSFIDINHITYINFFIN